MVICLVDVKSVGSGHSYINKDIWLYYIRGWWEMRSMLVTVEDKQYERLRKQSYEQRRSMSAIVREILGGEKKWK